MTLADLGKKVGVGASTVRKWETGDIKDMRSDKIQKVAQALDVTSAYIMGWEEQTGFDERVELGLNIEEAELLRIYQSLSVRGRVKLLTAAMDIEAADNK